MKRNIIITIVAIIIIILLIRSSKPIETQDSNSAAGTTERVMMPGEQQPEDAPSTPTKTISGVITEKDDGCFADGICRINVGGVWVITNQGWYQGPLGTTPPELAVGMTVEAFGKVTPEGITMLGSDSYYVKAK